MVDKDKLSELWRKGYSAPVISDITGWKVDTIYKLVHKLGLPKHKNGVRSVLDTDIAKRRWFIRNYPEMSNETISVYLGLSPDYIGELARKMGLKKSESYWEGIKEYQKKRIREFHNSKKGDKEYYAYNKRPRDKGKFIKKEKP